MASSLNIKEQDGSISFDILVAPRASREKIGPIVGERLKIAVSSPPVEGQANEAIVALLARALRVKRQDVTILVGEKGKRKTVRIKGIQSQRLLDLLHPNLTVSSSGGRKEP